jgi:nucleoside triphosphate pyrophosphatase
VRWRFSSRSLAERPTLILASRSPQRRAILEQLGIPFAVVVSDVIELEAGGATEVAIENARRKALAVSALHPGALVLGADTVVRLDDTLYGKPAGTEQAGQMLRALSGRTHAVVGGICLTGQGATRTAAARTAVSFRQLPEPLIEWYLESGEWRERAGSYAIQGRGAALVAGIDGDYLNVVGLPVATLLELAPELLG